MRLIAILGLVLIMASMVSAVDIFTDPYSDTFTASQTTGKTLYQIRQEQNFKSCTEQANWESKNCDYMYYCYVVLPASSDNLNDALLKECQEVSDETDATLTINQFLPPRGVLYYVTSFIAITNHQYSDITQKWSVASTRVPTEYLDAGAIRSVCPTGQMLGMKRDFGGVPIEPACFLAERVCIDSSSTGLCTNAFPLFVMDIDEDGNWEDNVGDATAYCADRNRDRICDFVVDFECVDVCSGFSSDGVQLQCTNSGANGICDEWDMASVWSCIDSELSPNSNICDTIDNSVCTSSYEPVCVGGGVDQTMPNKCFAEANGYSECADDSLHATTDCYIGGTCEPAIVQCYVPEDCPNANVCLGGSTTGVSKLCLGNMCAYSGACANLACASNADCEGMDLPCVGVAPACNGGVCTIQGQCLTQPTPTDTFNIFDLLASIWNAIIAFIRSLFGG